MSADRINRRKFIEQGIIAATAAALAACGGGGNGKGNESSQYPTRVPSTTPTPTARPDMTATPTERLTSTPIEAKTFTPEPSPTLDQSWQPYESEGGIPFNGTVAEFDVAPDEIEVLTAGPARIAGVDLPGGETRGSIILMLPDQDSDSQHTPRVIRYRVDNLIPGSNWHGSYRPLQSNRNAKSISTWASLAKDRAQAMIEAPNCSFGTGCETLDILVVKPGNEVAFQTTVTADTIEEVLK